MRKLALAFSPELTLVHPFPQALAVKGQGVVYKSVHEILGEGDFVLGVTEATSGGVPTDIYDLYRIENRKIAEHWDTLEAIPLVANGRTATESVRCRQ